MLQPTSCGPGPPDKIVEFKQNLNEMREKPDKQERIREKENENNLKQQLYSNNCNDDYDDNEYACIGKLNNEYDVGRNSIKGNENSNSNYNCHLNRNKLYFNKITAITATTTALTSVTKSPTLFHTNNIQKNIAHNYTASVAATATVTAIATSAAAVTALAVIKEKIRKNSFKFETVSVAVANVANNLNKFYKNFTSVTATATATATTSTSTSTSTSIKWFLMFLMLFNILAQTPHQVAAEKSKHCK